MAKNWKQTGWQQYNEPYEVIQVSFIQDQENKIANKFYLFSMYTLFFYVCS